MLTLLSHQNATHLCASSQVDSTGKGYQGYGAPLQNHLGPPHHGRTHCSQVYIPFIPGMMSRTVL